MTLHVMSVLHAPTFSGPHNQVLRLDEPLQRRGIRTLALLPDEEGSAAPRLRDGGIEVVTMPLHRLRARRDPRVHAAYAAYLPREVRAIRCLIRRHAIDVVLANSLYNPHAAIAARLERVGVVWQLIDTVAPVLVRRIMSPAVIRLSDIVMTTGTSVARMHPGVLDMGERCVPFSPPVDTHMVRPDAARRRDARRELECADDEIVVGMVGNLNPTKGHYLIIQAVAALRTKHPKLQLRLLSASTPGHEAYEAGVRRLVAELGLGDHRRVLRDPGSRVAELMPGLDIFALTSVPRSEGLPTVILEAMSCGVPVVATDVGSVGEVVDNGVTGYVVRPLDQVSIEASLSKLVSDPAARRRMGGVARVRATAKYDVEICAQLHAEVIGRAATLAAERAWRIGR